MSTQHTPRNTSGAKNAQALAVFDELQALQSGLHNKDFWPRFTPAVRLLLRSPMVLSLSMADGPECLLALDQGEDEPSLPDVSAVQLQAIHMAGNLPERGFQFEPLDAGCPLLDEPFLLVFELPGTETLPRYITAVVLEHGDVSAFNELVVRSQLIRHSWRTAQANFQQTRANNDADTVSGGQIATASASVLSDQELVYTLAVLERVSSKPGFVLACMTLVDELAAHFDCSKVSLGQIRGDYLQLLAISHVESFDRNSDAIKEQEFLQEEAVDQWQRVQSLGGAERNAYLNQDVISASHDRYCRTQALSQVVSIPFGAADAGDPEQPLETFCLTLECKEGELTERQQLALEVLLNQLSPWLTHSHQQDLWPHQKLLRRLRRWGYWWLGPNNTLTKLMAVSASVALILSVLIRVEYQIEAVANLETDNIAYLSAPFNGFVKEVALEPGDQASKGQLVARLDTEELELKALQEEASLVRFDREAEKARSQRKLVDMKVALARKAQAEAELARVRYYLDHAELRSPFDGIVVEGEREELLGAPVDKGDLMLKIANPVGLYARVKLPERDVDDVEPGALASLKLLSRPDQTFDFVVMRIVPQASIDASDGNVFVVRANSTVKQVPDWWRPGMSGVIHIDAGQRSLLWIALHRTLDAIRMELWI